MHAPDGKRYRATVHYDGSAFAGWQVQPDVRTVQGDIEASLHRMGIEGRVRGAGRTDAGVHAAGQEMSFDAPATRTLAELARALDSLLPGDIWIEVLREADPDFHPRFHATGRRYEYFFAPGPAGRAPYRRRGTTALPEAPDLEALRAAARQVVGRHDFRRFSRSGQPDVRTICRVEMAEWVITPLGDLRFTVVADRFLHRMVRYLVATMVQQSEGRRPEDDIPGLLAGDAGPRPPIPAEPSGLYLTGVRYREGWNRPPGVPGLWPVRVGTGQEADTGNDPSEES